MLYSISFRAKIFIKTSAYNDYYQSNDTAYRNFSKCSSMLLMFSFCEQWS